MPYHISLRLLEVFLRNLQDDLQFTCDCKRPSIYKTILKIKIEVFKVISRIAIMLL